MATTSSSSSAPPLFQTIKTQILDQPMSPIPDGEFQLHIKPPIIEIKNLSSKQVLCTVTKLPSLTPLDTDQVSIIASKVVTITNGFILLFSKADVEFFGVSITEPESNPTTVLFAKAYKINGGRYLNLQLLTKRRTRQTPSHLTPIRPRRNRILTSASAVTMQTLSDPILKKPSTLKRSKSEPPSTEEYHTAPSSPTPKQQ